MQTTTAYVDSDGDLIHQGTGMRIREASAAERAESEEAAELDGGSGVIEVEVDDDVRRGLDADARIRDGRSAL